MFKPILIVAGLLTLIAMAGSGQNPPNLSGNWVLVTATVSGGRSAGRTAAPQASAETPTTSNTVSGAAFNCGRECTIVHKGRTLAIEKALLGSDEAPAQVVTLHLDGRQISVADTFSPSRKIGVTADWNGNKLQIISSTASRTVTSFNRDAARPVTFRYRKK
jgi:hypothetical protein